MMSIDVSLIMFTLTGYSLILNVLECQVLIMYIVHHQSVLAITGSVSMNKLKDLYKRSGRSACVESILVEVTENNSDQGDRGRRLKKIF